MYIDRGTFKEHFSTLLPLFEQHWKEIGMVGSNGLELKVDSDVYLKLEEQGLWLGMGIRQDDGEIIAYLSIFIYGHHHHKGVNFAMTDCFFMNPRYRSFASFKAVLKLFKEAEKVLKSEFNVSYIQLTCSISNKLGFLAESLGFKESDIMYLKKVM